jgi:hypothetical protein
MLESSRLLLLSWVPEPSEPGGRAKIVRTRQILDAVTRAPLGAARSELLEGWRGCLAGLWFEVYEGEDQALLCQLDQCWLPWPGWRVWDADGRRVGTVRRTALHNPFGRRWARIERLDRGSRSQFQAPDGHELGTVASCAEGLVLAFSLELAGDPFGKMMLLAATLLQ